MTAQQWAADLDGCQQGAELTTQQIADAATDAVAIIFYKDSGHTCFYGALSGEYPNAGTDRIFFRHDNTNFCGWAGEAWNPEHVGGLENCPNYVELDENENGWPYSYWSNRPCYEFEILDSNNDPWCKGVVMAVSDMATEMRR